MEIKTCEQYVLAELEKAQNEVEDLKDFIKCQHKEILQLREALEKCNPAPIFDKIDIE